jgi:hypothetical protein
MSRRQPDRPPRPSSSSSASLCTELWARDLGKLPAFQVDWLWQGYLARGSITLLTSQWKTGKTTLVALLLARLARGGQLAELPVKPGRAVVLSEEPPQLWQLRHQRLKFGPDTCFMCRPFEGKPTEQQWQGLVRRLAELHDERGVDLVVVDPISLLLPPYFESHAERMQAALLPLSRLTRLGMAVLLLHHPKKGDALAGQSARGSGAACAMVDVLLELSWHARGDVDDRRRRLLAWSRYDETPRERSIELSADGRDYRLGVARSEDEFAGAAALIEGLLRERIGLKRSRRQLYDDWPQRPKPDRVTLWRWLDRAVARGQVRQEGNGTRIDPYRYWLPGDKAEWRPDSFETLGL